MKTQEKSQYNITNVRIDTMPIYDCVRMVIVVASFVFIGVILIFNYILEFMIRNLGFV